MPTYFGTSPYNFYQDITSGGENAIDGNRDTYTTTTTLVMPLGTVPMTPAAVTFNTLHFSCQGATSYSLTNMGGTQLVGSTTAPKNINGACAMTGERQYVTAAFDAERDSQVSLTVGGTSARIYEAYIFNSAWSWDPLNDEFVGKIAQTQGIELRGSVTHEALDGTLTTTPPLNGFKYNVTYTFQVAGDNFSSRILSLYTFLASNLNFTHVVDSLVYPDRVYRATLPNPMELTAINRNLDTGERISLSIRQK